MIKINRKGVSMIEVLVVIALLAIITPMIFSDLLFGLNTYRTYDNYMNQQYSIMEAIQFIRKDIEICTSYNVENDAAGKYSRLTLMCLSDPKDPASTPEEKVWELSNGSLNIVKGADKSIIVEGINTDAEKISDTDSNTRSRFTPATNGNDYKITFIVLPESYESNYTMNVNKPIITEYSVRYKPTLVAAATPISTVLPTPTPTTTTP